MNVSIAIILTLFIAFQTGSAERSKIKEGPIPHPDCPEIDNPFNSTQLPHPKDCGKFYKCAGGLAFPMKCPAGLHWYSDGNRCDWPDEAKCHTKFQPKLKNRLINKLDDAKPIKHPKCPINDNTENPTHLVYPGNCSKFYKCFNGYAYPMSCPSGLHWSIALNSCDYQSVADCEIYKLIKQTYGEDAPINNGECPVSDDPEHPKHLPHSDCNKFYRCANGLAYPMNCPTGQHWSTKLDRCDWPAVAKCDQNYLTTTEEPTPSTTVELTDESKVTDAGVWTTTDEWITTDESTILEESATNKPLPDVTENWTPTDDEITRDETTILEESATNKPLPDVTENWTLTDDEITRDETTILEESATNRPLPDVTDACKNMDNTSLLPHPTDCTKFIQCDNARVHIRQCPAKLHFSVLVNRCQWPEIANCTIKGQ